MELDKVGKTHHLKPKQQGVYPPLLSLMALREEYE